MKPYWNSSFYRPHYNSLKSRTIGDIFSSSKGSLIFRSGSLNIKKKNSLFRRSFSILKVYSVFRFFSKKESIGLINKSFIGRPFFSKKDTFRLKELSLNMIDLLNKDMIIEGLSLREKALNSLLSIEKSEDSFIS